LARWFTECADWHFEGNLKACVRAVNEGGQVVKYGTVQQWMREAKATAQAEADGQKVDKDTHRDKLMAKTKKRTYKRRQKPAPAVDPKGQIPSESPPGDPTTQQLKAIALAAGAMNAAKVSGAIGVTGDPVVSATWLIHFDGTQKMIDRLLQTLKEHSLAVNVHVELVEQEPERAPVPESEKGDADADEEVTDIECATELAAV
jgi:hypothetical protein